MSPYRTCVGYVLDVFNGVAHNTNVVQVDPKTVCLYSNKKDKKGKEIFQGDIIENQNGLRFEVRYGEFAMYCPVDNCMMENVGFYAVAEGYYEDMPLGATETYATVIGNIHDNPDLKVDDKYRCIAELN